MDPTFENINETLSNWNDNEFSEKIWAMAQEDMNFIEEHLFNHPAFLKRIKPTLIGELLILNIKKQIIPEYFTNHQTVEECIATFENILKTFPDILSKFNQDPDLDETESNINHELASCVFSNNFKKLLPILKAFHENGYRYRISEEYDVISLFHYSHPPETTYALLDLGIDFLEQNHVIQGQLGHPDIYDYSFTRHWTNFLPQKSAQESNGLEKIQAFKKHPRWKDEDWKLWDLQTLEHPAFQAGVLWNDGVPKENSIKNQTNSHAFLQYIAETYYEQRHSIQIKITYNSIGFLNKSFSLMEFMGMVADEKPFNYMKIRETLPSTPLISSTPRL